MDTAAILTKLDAATRAIGDARAIVEASTAPAPLISTPTEFERALAAAIPGTVLVLAPTFQYAAPFMITVPRLTLVTGDASGQTRIEADRLLATFQGAITIAADDVSLVGIEARNTKQTDVITFTRSGARSVVDRCRVLGDPKDGGKRGIAANGNGDCAILRSIVKGHRKHVGAGDSQAICAWDMAPGLTIDDCTLADGAEVVMIGGADCADASRIPTGVAITNCDISHPLEDQFADWIVKNLVEFKNCIGGVVQHNRCSGSWGGHGQTGYAFAITPRNQSGNNPFAVCKDITFTNNEIAHVSACATIAGDDDLQLSERTMRVAFGGNVWTDVDPKLYTGSNKLYQIGRGPLALTIQHEHVTGRNIGSQVYFYSPIRRCERLQISDCVWPTSRYGIFGDAISPATTAGALAKYVEMATSIVDRNTDVAPA